MLQSRLPQHACMESRVGAAELPSAVVRMDVILLGDLSFVVVVCFFPF